ncbi:MULTISPECIES: holo-ACP synthase [Paraclostridium]|jgi:holo-[acyl-carrier protein] synthase|uniref:Holo-[acyl-carrier-protein] synthase n=1 Tax=Paraclostridium bifermentans TaxID=1490 RepID=A0A1X2JEH5_PARBF|nr:MULTISPECIES: holo-ACP synthase [Paraclostridium]MCU9809462.1 holo-ACP synthase [Paraclostridium sp. AKS46]MDV8115573.1 holo-ACP synthase [Bacillus sp. BAU-SS-2023]MBN8049291.1 holo-ACP synthase [Paraclostridium bifermentans]MBZ6007061.1 holo-ACP synthase [Paraclostridium bifermentans]MCE9677147.1 holo-ACP synthase [Paraclostridium bifermentans]
MNILGIGIDIVEIERIENILKNKKRFLNKIFTDEEIKYFESKNFRSETIAGNFSAKEAISKAFGTGIKNFNFDDIEVLRDKNGKPIVKTYNNLRQMCIDYNVLEIQVSISHSENYAVANAMVIVKE